MTNNTAIALESLPGAREVLRELEFANGEPLVHLIRGRSGTGKSTLLSAIRARLRAHGVTACEDMEAALNGSGPRALIVDDVHTLDAPELDKLCAAVESGSCTVVMATRPHPHDQALRTLTDATARRGRVLELRALGVADIAPFARELGMMVPRAVAAHIHRQTAGIHSGVVAALTAAAATRLDGGIAAVEAAVTEWARTLLNHTDPRLLEVLAVAATGAGLDSDELSEVLGVDRDVVVTLIDDARAGALVTDADLLLEPAVAPLRTLLGDRRYLSVQRRLLQTRLDTGLLRDHTALLLAESGVQDPRLAEFLCAHAEKVGADALRYYRAAAAAGADPEAIAVRWADAAARAGDSDTALRLAEPVLARACAPENATDATGPAPTPTDLALAVRTCAGVWARRSLMNRAAQLYSWLGAHRVGADWANGATVLYLSGEPEQAAAFAASAVHWPPTETTVRSATIAGALARTVTTGPVAEVQLPLPPVNRQEWSLAGFDSDAPPRNAGGERTRSAVAALIQAARSNGAAGAERSLPCSSAAIATLLCLSMGEPRRAADALRGCAKDPQAPVLSAWVSMLGGDEQAAATTMSQVDVAELPPRDRLLAHGVLAGLARRGGDDAALALAWESAYPLLDEVGPDLLALLPIGELWLTAIRLRDEGRVLSLVDGARELLGRLSDPPAWANAFHWYAIQAAIAKGSPDELLPPAHRLKEAAAAGDPHAAVLADAGRNWVLMLRGQVDPDRVTAAAVRLADIGLRWDAAKLASEAALVVGDSAAATTLLKLARTIRAQARPQVRPVVRPEPAAPPPEQRVAPANDVLSEREREVAELVLLGLTYREIGARLYISAKTVEHHVARIRRRIGAGSRSELLSMLRAMGHGSLLV
ncbi:LuxR C-terminal-related transcriptional regulator [Nocardia stercoris]|uniref:LuxR family transcriptional regulator n=1 Tax=Nocardia stercoris TaxID=2483361 RepID=A0A3M2KSP8_9NOCA|nr:LuxR C-terminal-related transcriptional regulator [Nocardia stercoris]RMI28697.1 LuxR family transcriptional regulator [Nocardia stercoris]